MSNCRSLPRGRAKLAALEVAIRLAGAIHEMENHRGLSHLRDHLVRAADNTALRLSEASGRTLGNRYQHLEAAYAENQEVQCDLLLMRAQGALVPDAVLRAAGRLGGLVYGLLRAEHGRRHGELRAAPDHPGCGPRAAGGGVRDTGSELRESG